MATRLFNSKNSMFCEKLRVVLSMKKVPTTWWTSGPTSASR